MVDLDDFCPLYHSVYIHVPVVKFEESVAIVSSYFYRVSSFYFSAESLL